MPTDLPADPGREHQDRIDASLLREIAERRDRAAMESLYERFKPRLSRFLRRLTTDDELIEEAVNDVMLTVWRKAHQYQARSKPSSWVFSIAYRTALRMVKKQQRHEATVEIRGDDLPEVAVAGADSDHTDALVAAVRRLSAKQRIVVELCYFEGYALEDIAAVVKCPLNTVKTRLHHARKNLRNMIDDASRALGSPAQALDDKGATK